MSEETGRLQHHPAGPSSGLVVPPRLGPALQPNPNLKCPTPGIQPSVTGAIYAHTHSQEVNSNTLGLCALHQSGAVCTKAANPETEAWRCRRRAERTCFVLFGPTTVTLAAGITGKRTHGSWTCRFNTPWLVCGLSSPAVARILLGLGSEMSRRGACRIHCLSEIR